MAEVNPLDAALEDVDALVAKEVVKVMRDLIQIAHNCEDARARVSAASKVIDYARPPKSGPMVAINMPSVISHLHLPAGRQKQKQTKAIDVTPAVPTSRQKILPESNPIHGTKFRGNFDASNPVQPKTPLAPTPAALVPRSKTPASPARPPSASSIRPLAPGDE